MCMPYVGLNFSAYDIDFLVGDRIGMYVCDSIPVQGYICGFRAYEAHTAFMYPCHMSV